jgi:ABC-type multidrug transport system fused ATPase/permease subunit
MSILNMIPTGIKKILTNNFSSLAYFYRHLRHRLFVSLVLSFGVGLLDGFGLAMFLPLLQLVTADGETATGEGMGGMEFIVDALSKLGVPLTLGTVLTVIMIFFTLKGIALFVQRYYEVIVRMYFIKNLRFENIDGLVHYKYKSFVLADTGRIQNTLSGEIGRVTGAYTFYFKMLKSLMMLLVYLGMAFLTNPQFAVLVIAGGMLSNLAYRQIYKRTKLVSTKITTGGHRYQRQLIQFVGHFKYLKSTGFLNQYSRKLKESVVYIENANKKIGYYNSLLEATREPLNIIVVSAVIFAQLYIFSSALNGIILALLFFYRALSYVMALQTSWNSFLNVSGSLENMTQFNIELKAHKEKYGKSSPELFKGELSIENVSFYYHDNKVLEDISIKIPAKYSVAFVGESGSGKTTLVNIIAGLVKPDNGNIRVDGMNYKDLDIRSLQRHIGYISQDPVIFSESIFDNITLWAKPTQENLDRFWVACEKAAIADFIRSLPESKETELGNNGIQLSGGQKQRISIARELFKEVSILIMDEATSALDSLVEREIQKNIDALKGEYTMIIVAHRLSTVKNVDRIFLLNEGRLENSGNFKELQEKSKRFKQMVQLQEF